MLLLLSGGEITLGHFGDFGGVSGLGNRSDFGVSGGRQAAVE